jgi:hypothetical protein
VKGAEGRTHLRELAHGEVPPGFLGQFLDRFFGEFTASFRRR